MDGKWDKWYWVPVMVLLIAAQWAWLNPTKAAVIVAAVGGGAWWAWGGA